MKRRDFPADHIEHFKRHQRSRWQAERDRRRRVERIRIILLQFEGSWETQARFFFFLHIRDSVAHFNDHTAGDETISRTIDGDGIRIRVEASRDRFSPEA